jgi:DNA recombination protein Rad52
MGFADKQLKALNAKLLAKHVRTRVEAGVTLSYVEGWHVIAEANRIFGFDGWDRQTVSSQCVWEGSFGGQRRCSYVARVRIQVQAGGESVMREGSGSGHGSGLTPGEAHEHALKEAETDAMKRALMTFGNQFGLALYDKKQRRVTPGHSKVGKSPKPRKVEWVVLYANGEPESRHEDPVTFCSAMRRILEKIETADEAMAFWKRNQETVAQLRQTLPHLTTDKGQHYAEIVSSLYTTRLQAFAEQKVAEQRPKEQSGRKAKIDKAELAMGEPRRIRDKEHLQYVASQSCLICGRAPSQAHHLRFAQARALSRKVSDEWTVPLCATHHRSLHDGGNEEQWWKERKVDPVLKACQLWRHTGEKGHGSENRVSKSAL